MAITLAVRALPRWIAAESELQYPCASRSPRDIDPALGEQVLDIPEAGGEANIKPHRGPDDHRGNWRHKWIEVIRHRTGRTETHYGSRDIAVGGSGEEVCFARQRPVVQDQAQLV
jgi:hypothetical protein